MTIVRRFRSDRSGVTALEFALVAPLFFALVFSTLEAGWLMTRSVLLGRALDQTVRLIRIAATDAPKTHAQMKKTVCEKAMVIENCESSIIIDMMSVKVASDIPTSRATCVDRSASIQPAVNFSIGEDSLIMYVRACIVSDPITPLLGLALYLDKDGKGGYWQTAASAFMNEPWENKS